MPLRRRIRSGAFWLSCRARRSSVSDEDSWKLIFEWSGATWLYDQTPTRWSATVYAPDAARARLGIAASTGGA